MDREKVVKQLECISEWLFRQYSIVYDGDAPNYYEAYKAVDDAISMLKEHEEVEPIRDETCVKMFRCGACHEYVGFDYSELGDPKEHDSYCRNCGRKVKWE